MARRFMARRSAYQSRCSMLRSSIAARSPTVSMIGVCQGRRTVRVGVTGRVWMTMGRWCW
ncbi:hypothetical protein EFE23_24680 [Micromonospora solifontis]|uniref:Uncharacterized protein n=1 Tax=Micromonospora solifontis TaxID=2487138 RepID=A0ABX9W9L3_9ACTN|nr:hypothetical protein EFE23_24680 [Micromonospora solifontis]